MLKQDIAETRTRKTNRDNRKIYVEEDSQDENEGDKNEK